MKTILKKLDWVFEYYFVYFLFKPDKLQRYHYYMMKKWGDKYCTKEEYEEYLKTLSEL
jgi:hypothetical protein